MGPVVVRLSDGDLNKEKECVYLSFMVAVGEIETTLLLTRNAFRSVQAYEVRGLVIYEII